MYLYLSDFLLYLLLFFIYLLFIDYLFNRSRAFRQAYSITFLKHLGASWRLLGPSWKHLGASWRHLESHLEPTRTLKQPLKKHERKCVCMHARGLFARRYGSRSGRARAGLGPISKINFPDGVSPERLARAFKD